MIKHLRAVPFTVELAKPEPNDQIENERHISIFCIKPL